MDKVGGAAESELVIIGSLILACDRSLFSQSPATLEPLRFVLSCFYSFQSTQLQLKIIDIAPPPRFAGLERLHDRMIGGVEMFGCMFIFGRIAAADVSAFPAQAQMDPAVSHF
jgi:hypothetical protein